EARGQPLDGVAPSFVPSLPAGDVPCHVLIAQCPAMHASWPPPAPFSPAFAHADAGHHLVATCGKQSQHATRMLVIAGFAENLVTNDHRRVGGDDHDLLVSIVPLQVLS